MSAEKNPQPFHNKQSRDKNNDKKTCLKCGELLENNEPAVLEDVFPDDEFVCPACCCGIYIEVKE